MNETFSVHCNIGVINGKITSISIHSIPEPCWKLLPGKRITYDGTTWKQIGRYTFFLEEKKGTQDEHHES